MHRLLKTNHNKIIFLFFQLFVSGSIVSIFLILYLYLNQKIPSDKGGLVYIEQKLKQLENGLNKHKLKFSEIKKRIDTIKVQGNENTIYNEPNLKNELLERDEIIPRHNEGTCNINTDSVPKPDIQMLDVYRDLPFDNPGICFLVSINALELINVYFKMVGHGNKDGRWNMIHIIGTGIIN